ncbi:lipopolysaccharide biosynthesis protein [Shewanella frigidimarina]|uniref:lipopolysaccharide biosynthesis protein n=1 Tax=Shewanella frigidimarina TaxID=56812 RepID=UPI003D79F142
MFIKNIVKLVTGTVTAQLLPFFVLPFLTRTMGAENFGIYSLFFTTMVMLGTLSALRFDYAITAAKTALQAKLIFILCLVINVLTLILILIVFLMVISLGYLSNIWLLLPFAVFLMSINQSYYFYANTKGEFGVMASSRVINAVVCALAQFLLVVVLDYSSGAFLGLLVGFALSTLYLHFKVSLTSSGIKTNRLIFIFKRYINYPKLVFPGTFINFLSGNMPIYVIGFLFGAAQAGYYSLAIRVAGIPTTMVGRSVGEVYRLTASKELKSIGNFRSIFIKVASISLVISILGFSILFFFAQPLFEIVFGKGWDNAAFYTQILIPMFILQFATAPVSYSLMLSNWQRRELDWQVFRLALISCLFICAYIFNSDLITYVVFSSFALFSSFLLYFYLCFKSSKTDER